jgi:hypothetical protein
MNFEEDRTALKIIPYGGSPSPPHPGTPPSRLVTPLACPTPLHTGTPSLVKRCLSNTPPPPSPPPSSPPPSLAPNLKRDRKKITSSVRNATEISQEIGKPKLGLLKFFSKGTPADTKAYWDREERVAVTQSSNDYSTRYLGMEKKVLSTAKTTKAEKVEEE